MTCDSNEVGSCPGYYVSYQTHYFHSNQHSHFCDIAGRLTVLWSVAVSGDSKFKRQDDLSSQRSLEIRSVLRYAGVIRTMDD